MNCPNCGRVIKEVKNYHSDNGVVRRGLPAKFHILTSTFCKECPSSSLNSYDKTAYFLHLEDGSVYMFIFGQTKWELLHRKVPSAKHIGGFKVIQT